MRIETATQCVQIDDIPMTAQITQITVDLAEQRVEITYKGHPPLVYQPSGHSADSASWQADQ